MTHYHIILTLLESDGSPFKNEDFEAEDDQKATEIAADWFGGNMPSAYRDGELRLSRGDVVVWSRRVKDRVLLVN
jgi:hypothetical protein